MPRGGSGRLATHDAPDRSGSRVNPSDEERDPDRRLEHHHDARGQPRPAGRPPKAFESRALVVDRSWGEIRDAAVLGRRRVYARRPLVLLDTPERQ